MGMGGEGGVEVTGGGEPAEGEGGEHVKLVE